MFMGDVADTRTAAIYVLEELDQEQRREHEESAFYGSRPTAGWQRAGSTQNTKYLRSCPISAASRICRTSD
jgi:hypothetical protein